MNNRLIIVGAGGHGKVLADNALKNGYTEIAYLDDFVKGDCMGFPILGPFTIMESLNDGKTDFVIGIGNNDIRRRVAETYQVNWVALIHPSAELAFNVKVGKGTVVMAGAVINVCARIGEHCIVNSEAIVEHDNNVGNFVHISPKVALGGTVSVGERTHIGISATVKNNITICQDCIIGACALVTKDIDHSGTYVGIPAKEVL